MKKSGLPKNIFPVPGKKGKLQAYYTYKNKKIHVGTFSTVDECLDALQESQMKIKDADDLEFNVYDTRKPLKLPKIDPHFPSLSTLWNPTCQHQQISLSQ